MFFRIGASIRWSNASADRTKRLKTEVRILATARELKVEFEPFVLSVSSSMRHVIMICGTSSKRIPNSSNSPELILHVAILLLAKEFIASK
jgi:hypothetical protein